MSRRRLLGTMAVGAGVATVTSATGLAGTAAAQRRRVRSRRSGRGGVPGDGQSTGTFGRMFPDLPPFAEPSDALTAALIDIGRPGGLLDAGDDLAAGPVALITDPALRVANPDNPESSAGITFLGQFADHDLTFDPTSPLGVPTDPTDAPNARTATFDLDSLYGGGPSGSPQLYDDADRAKLRIESGGLFEDLPRDGAGRAVIADPRNDENLMVSGLQAAMILFHDNVVDEIRSRSGRDLSANRVFERARSVVRAHYQWILLHEFLPRLVGQAAVDRALEGRRHFRSSVPYMPVECQIAYRVGHTMIRPSYRANLAGDDGEPFFGLVFDPGAEGRADPVDLRGGARAPRRFIGWQTFFDFGDGEVKPNKLIDTKISSPLFTLPLRAIASGEPPISLATRNLLRHLTWSVPSGQDCARAMGVPVLPSTDLAELAGYGLGLESSTPLWHYVLKEAEVMEGGLRMGPVGAGIVADVFVELLSLSPSSILGRERAFRPSLPRRAGDTGDFNMVDLLTFAGVDPASRGQ